MRTTFAFLALAILESASLMAGPGNVMLEYTMKAITKDCNQVNDVIKLSDPADATDAMILTAIVRSRTASASLQLVIDRKDGEMFPGLIAGLPPEKQKEMLGLYVQYLSMAQQKLAAVEVQLKSELDKENPESREFKSAGKTMKELEGVITEAHKLFRPPQPRS